MTPCPPALSRRASPAVLSSLSATPRGRAEGTDTVVTIPHTVALLVTAGMHAMARVGDDQRGDSQVRDAIRPHIPVAVTVRAQVGQRTLGDEMIPEAHEPVPPDASELGTHVISHLPFVWSQGQQQLKPKGKTTFWTPPTPLCTAEF